MHKNNNIKTRSFLQGLRPFSSTIPRGLKKILRKGGYNFSSIVDNWTKIIGKDISSKCYPLKIKNNKEFDNGVVFLNVLHGKELEIEYEKKNIMDKINSFFGYEIIKSIKLKIVRANEKMKDKKEILNNSNSKLKSKLKQVKDPELKKTLNKLIQAYEKKDH